MNLVGTSHHRDRVDDGDDLCASVLSRADIREPRADSRDDIHDHPLVVCRRRRGSRYIRAAPQCLLQRL
jgi:hypothetical protein